MYNTDITNLGWPGGVGLGPLEYAPLKASGSIPPVPISVG